MPRLLSFTIKKVYLSTVARVHGPNEKTTARAKNKILALPSAHNHIALVLRQQQKTLFP